MRYMLQYGNVITNQRIVLEPRIMATTGLMMRISVVRKHCGGSILFRVV
jgi:hypothetical protein